MDKEQAIQRHPFFFAVSTEKAVQYLLENCLVIPKYIFLGRLF